MKITLLGPIDLAATDREVAAECCKRGTVLR